MQFQGDVGGGVRKVFGTFGNKREQKGKARIAFEVWKVRRMARRAGVGLLSVQNQSRRWSSARWPTRNVARYRLWDIC